MKQKTQPAPTLALHYRRCLDGTIRVWRNDWHGDQFEVIRGIGTDVEDTFDMVATVMRRFAIPMVDVTGTDD
jgi:hypothetical protein